MWRRFDLAYFIIKEVLDEMLSLLEKLLQEEKNRIVSLIRESVNEISKHYEPRSIQVRNLSTRETTLDIYTIVSVKRANEITVKYEIQAGFREKGVHNIIFVYVPAEPNKLKGHVLPSDIDFAIMELIDRKLTGLNYQKSSLGQLIGYKKQL